MDLQLRDQVASLLLKPYQVKALKDLQVQVDVLDVTAYLVRQVVDGLRPPP